MAPVIVFVTDEQTCWYAKGFMTEYLMSPHFPKAHRIIGMKRYSYLTIWYVSQYRGHDTIRIAIHIFTEKKEYDGCITRCFHYLKSTSRYFLIYLWSGLFLWTVGNHKYYLDTFETSTFSWGKTVKTLRISSLRAVHVKFTELSDKLSIQSILTLWLL